MDGAASFHGVAVRNRRNFCCYSRFVLGIVHNVSEEMWNAALHAASFLYRIISTSEFDEI
jgi:hypothetical protein